MTTSGIEVLVASPRYCDHCQAKGHQRVANYDAKTAHGYWAYLCEVHFIETGGQLGLGKGQRLIIKSSR